MTISAVNITAENIIPQAIPAVAALPTPRPPVTEAISNTEQKLIKSNKEYHLRRLVTLGVTDAN